jgi:small subunit ribosomal protein S17
MDQVNPEGQAAVSRRRRQEKMGIVVRDKMDKTVIVEVERPVIHSLYEKFMRRRSHFMAHDEKNECRVGDRVILRETRPLSRRKRWAVKTVLEKAVQK